MPGFFSLSQDYTLLVVAGGAALLGAISGVVGCLALIKKQSLMADAISHASLPGIVLAFILTGTRTHSVLLAGAAVAGWIAAMQMFLLVQKGNLKQDSSLSMMLSVYFGFGMVLLTLIQHRPGAAQAGIETFLFGEAATMLLSDVKLIGITGGVILFLLILFWKELFLVAFDPGYAAASGLPVHRLEALFVLLVVGSVVVGLQTVGVVLMSAMLIAPAAAARQWTNNMKVMMFLGMMFGAFAGATGSLLSSIIPKLPTGPTIIIIISLIAFLSFFFAPARGLIWAYLRKKHKQEKINAERVLTILYMLAKEHPEAPYYGHKKDVIECMLPARDVSGLLDELRVKGLATLIKPDLWTITPTGITYMQRVIADNAVKAQAEAVL